MPGLFHRLQRLFRPSRPRHPLLRVGFALLGLLLIVLLVLGSAFIGLGMLAFHLVRKLRREKTAPRRPGVIDAEYRVVPPRVVPQSR